MSRSDFVELGFVEFRKCRGQKMSRLEFVELDFVAVRKCRGRFCRCIRTKYCQSLHSLVVMAAVPLVHTYLIITTIIDQLLLLGPG